MEFKEFNLKNSVHISDEHGDALDIASFNPKYDKITNANIMLDIPDKQIILDQSIYNSCVGHSLAMCSSLLHYKYTNKWIDFDPYVVYGTVVGNQWAGEGMYAYQAIQNCVNEGFYFRRDFNIQGERPWITSEVSKFKQNNPDLVTQAKDYAFTAYALIDNDWQYVKRSLMLGMPVSATWKVYSSFFSTGSNGVVPIPNTRREAYLGNHQMTIVGIRDDNKYIVVNSYGENYGFKGMYFIPFGYGFAQAYSISDTIIPAKYKAKKIVMKINDPNVLVDDDFNISDVNPVIINDRTMIPVRLLTEALGASVEWIEQTRTVIVRSEEAVIKMNVGNRNYTIDGNNYVMDTEPIIVNDRTLVPIRFISEALNCDVSWDQNTQTATIVCL